MFILLIVYLVSCSLSFAAIMLSHFQDQADKGQDITIGDMLISIFYSITPIWNLLILGVFIYELTNNKFKKILNIAVFKGYKK